MDFTKIDALRDDLGALRPLSEAEVRRLRGEFVVESTYNSNAIEGSSLTLRETALILQEGVTIAEKPLREHLEAIGHRDAFEYIASIAGAGAGLTELDIKGIHSLVLMNDAANKGVYRRLPVAIMGASHTPPQPYLVPVQMEELIAGYPDMKGRMHIIEAVAEFHLRFEGIHPFIDGNGRVGRLIINLELMRAGLLPIDIKFAGRGKYYDCFGSYYGSGQSAGPMVRLIAEYETERLERYIGMVSKI
ncbi:MAG: Fic family protein [Chitinispirillia bacterium]|nr:Fic family protein [Chitinispirillia bacterium]MCL2184032.1 Fic family protein [Chitinispirillia bacterium]